MEKRVFLAIFLSFLVFAAYQAYFAPSPPRSGHERHGRARRLHRLRRRLSSRRRHRPPLNRAPAIVAKPLVADTTARDIVVETDTVRAVFSTAGATLKSWKLKQYLEDGAPLELVPQEVPDTYPRPFTLSTNDAGLSKTLATALYRPSAETLALGSAAGTLTFEYRDESGLNARKTFELQPEGKTYVREGRKPRLILPGRHGPSRLPGGRVSASGTRRTARVSIPSVPCCIAATTSST